MENIEHQKVKVAESLFVTYIILQLPEPWSTQSEWSRPWKLLWLSGGASAGPALLVLLPNSPKTCWSPCLPLRPLLHIQLLHGQGSRRCLDGEKYDPIDTNGHRAEQCHDWVSLHHQKRFTRYSSGHLEEPSLCQENLGRPASGSS